LILAGSLLCIVSSTPVPLTLPETIGYIRQSFENSAWSGVSGGDNSSSFAGNWRTFWPWAPTFRPGNRRHNCKGLLWSSIPVPSGGP